MLRLKSLAVSAVVLLIILSCLSFSKSKALHASINQSRQGDNGQPMQALLNEVHELRLLIQRSNVSIYHAQVTLERLRLQQQRVDRLSARLGEVRDRIAEIRSHEAKRSEDLKRVEEELSKETDSVRRHELAGLQQMFKQEPEHLVRMLEQETQLIAQLQPEQAKLSEINDRLDTLQKELEVVDKPQASEKRQ